MAPRRIDLPPSRGVSRKHHAPEDCFAYEIPNVLSREECLRLIEVATNSALPQAQRAPTTDARGGLSSSSSPMPPLPHAPTSFRYITHAIHTAPDGHTKFEVELERPNPHKLAVFQHDAWVATLWDRLRPLLVPEAKRSSSSSSSSSSERAAAKPTIRIDDDDQQRMQQHSELSIH
mmetsp:Transcript_19508/g.40207  ORF Transcript_19508/g.40207 Transcript_19508/m.40207 type:complete len:176 (+) Transcript_19508:2-529(+)